jgi:hypothetical protein
VWLAAGTDWPALATDWPLLLLLAALYVLLGRIDLFMVVEVDRGRYTDWSGSLNSVVLWTAILITGPVAGWFALADLFYTYLRNRRKDYMPGTRWRRRRNLMINAAVLPLATMCGAGVYTALGGVFPMPGFAPPVLGAALAGILAGFAVETALWLPLLVFLRGLQLRQATGKPALARAWWRFFTLGFLIPNLSLPFALLGAGLYSRAAVGGPGGQPPQPGGGARPPTVAPAGAAGTAGPRPAGRPARADHPARAAPAVRAGHVHLL